MIKRAVISTKFIRTISTLILFFLSFLCISFPIGAASAPEKLQIGYVVASYFDRTPAGKHYIFKSNSNFLVKELYGSQNNQITKGANFGAFTFNWSPNGKQIIFTQSTSSISDSEIFIMNFDNQGTIRLTKNKVYERDPTWSPDATKIAFGRNVAGGVSQIFVMNSDGSNSIQLTNIGEEGAILPTWSPDGNQIAFVGMVGGIGEIFTMMSDGSKVRQVTSGSGSYSPSWSPDGSKLVYQSFDSFSNSSSIWSSNLDGTNRIQLRTSIPGVYHRDPSWSPSGDKILFLSNKDGSYEVYVMNIDGSAMTKVVSAPTDKKSILEIISPRWRPQT